MPVLASAIVCPRFSFHRCFQHRSCSVPPLFVWRTVFDNLCGMVLWVWHSGS